MMHTRSLPWLLAAFAWLSVAAGPATAEPVRVDAGPVPLSAEDPALKTAGKLRYRGGLHLVSEDPRFGGFSALGVSADGGRMVAISDRGMRFSARLVYDQAGDLAGLRRGDLGALSGADGRPLASKQDADAESMSPGVEGEIIVAFERRHRLWRYLPGATLPEEIVAPPEMAELPPNNGIEALTLLADGRLLALSEGTRKRPVTVGWISGVGGWSVLTYRPREGFRVTGAATAPTGDVLVLERFYQPRGGNAVVIKRVRRETIKPDAVIAGETLGELRRPLSVDNFEGIDARRGAGGETIVYVISDDNFNRADQRTLLMMFEVAE